MSMESLDKFVRYPSMKLSFEGEKLDDHQCRQNKDTHNDNNAIRVAITLSQRLR